MTQSQTVTVDQQEILNRANEVEAPMADPPTDVPITPCVENLLERGRGGNDCAESHGHARG